MSESRLPHNLQGLLRFCMQAGDDPQQWPPSDAAAMDPERAQWLRDAINSLTVDIGKQLKDNIARLLQNTDAAAAGDAAAVGVCLACLEDTADLCDCLDVANDFVKLGGLDVTAYVCRRCVGASDLQAAALDLLARLFQNNPFAQAAGVGCVAELVGAVRGGSGSSVGVRFAALSALSCLVRDCPPAQAAFKESGGPAAVAGCLLLLRAADDGGGGEADGRRRLRRKAAFLLASLAAESDAMADRLAGCGADDADGVCDALATAIVEAAAEAEAEPEQQQQQLDWLEHAVGCLLALCQRGSGGSVDAAVGAPGTERRRRLADGLAALAARLPADRWPEAADRLARLLALVATGADPLER